MNGGTRTMTTRRAVAYGGLFCLLAAWLASAASTTFETQEQPVAPAAALPDPSPQTLAAEVQAQAAKLRQRLASAPIPQSPHRNPFLFESRPQAASRPLAPPLPSVQEIAPAPAAAPEPALFLVGVAEDQGAKGIVRTAILSDDAEAVFMVTVGETFLGRYRVEAIGPDVVELKDIGSEAIRRLALR
jgi:hypothetical protein